MFLPLHSPSVIVFRNYFNQLYKCLPPSQDSELSTCQRLCPAPPQTTQVWEPGPPSKVCLSRNKEEGGGKGPRCPQEQQKAQFLVPGRAVNVCPEGSGQAATGHAYSALDKWGNDSRAALDPACALAGTLGLGLPALSAPPSPSSWCFSG